jgi:hypothetical protein
VSSSITKAALKGLFLLAKLLVDDELDRQGTAHRFLGGRGDRLVVGVGVEAVAVVVEVVERLKRGPDVVETDLLGVKRPARGLDVVFELLGSLVPSVPVSHRLGPDPSGHPADHSILGVDGWRRRRRGWGEVVDVHARAR